MQRSTNIPNTQSINLVRILPVVCFFVIILSGTVFTLSNFPALPETQKSMVKGGWTAELEARINETIGFRQWAINTWGIIEYGLFKNGREGVLVGANGWLFTDEEFKYYPDEATETAVKLAYIQDVHEQLAAQGTELIIALVPSKARVSPEQLGRYHLPDYTVNRYDDFRLSLLEKGIAAPDLLTPLMQAKEHGDVFVRTDTHWTPYGARIVANTLTRNITPLNEGSFRSETGDTLAHTGDLLSFIPLGPLEHIGPGTHPIQLEFTTGLASGGGLFGDVSIPVALVGTSYSAVDTWNFAGALKVALQADVLNAALEGKGPIKPMQAYLVNEAFLQSPPEIVVWEFPERFIPVAYDMSASTNDVDN